MMKELGGQHGSMSVHMFVHGCMLVFICGRMGSGMVRKDVTTAEALQKAGQIMFGNPCIHVSALWACDL